MSEGKPSEASDQSDGNSICLPRNPSDVTHATENDTNLVLAATSSVGGAGPQDKTTETFCVVVVGKTGSGKSTVCNALLDTDENIFPVNHGIVPSSELQHEVNKKNGLHVVDTADVLNMGYETDHRLQQKCKEIYKMGPSDAITAFLFTIRFDQRFTPQDYNLYSNYLKLLAAKYRRNIIMVQVKAEQFEDAEKEMQNSLMKKVCEEFGDRVVVFPQSTFPQSREKFISDVLEHLNKMEFVNPDTTVDLRNITSTERPDRDQKSPVSPPDRDQKSCVAQSCSLM